MKMDAFAQLVRHREQAARKIKVHKTYINEDPNVEDVTHCPKCWSRNQQSSVRYMYINLNEAIYKCESASCMYPFRNFKFKNYTDKTVYYYTALDAEESAVAAPVLDDFLEMSSPSKGQPSPVKGQVGANSSLFDFNLDCFSPEKVASGSSPLSNIKTPDRNIFGSPSLLNLVKDFDTGFIDDILSELGGGAGSPEKQSSPVVRVTPPKPVATSKQLKRCLQMFQQKTEVGDVQGVFKVPPVPGTEPPVSPKSKTRKSPGEHRRRHKHPRRPKHSSSSSAVLDGPLSSEQILQKSRLSPLQFIESLNSRKPPDGGTKEPTPTPVPGIKRLGNQKVERMLNFIERSMKKRTPGTESPSTSSDERSPLKRANQFTSARRKDTRKLSLSAAVLQDSQFRYEGGAEEECVEPVVAASPEKEVPPSPPKQQAEAPPPVLPSFDELIDFIHPPNPSDPRWNHAA